MSQPRIDERYMSKFRWSTPREIDTSLGRRIYVQAKVTADERQTFLDQKLKFDSMAVTMKEHEGSWYFFRWSIPEKVRDEHGQTSIEQSRAADADIEIPCPAGLAYKGYQRAGVKYAMSRKGTLIADEQGLGKQQPIDTLVATPNGWVTIGSLKVGDYVIGSNGKPTKVTGVFPQGVKQSYSMNLSDGSSVESGPEHLWTVQYWKGGRRLDSITLTTEQIRTRPVVGSLNLSKTDLYIPILSNPIEFKGEPKLPIEPYLMGQLIANACLHFGTPVLVTNKLDWDEVSKLIPSYRMGSVTDGQGCVRVNIIGTIDSIRHLGVNVRSSEKFLPKIYLETNVQNRIDLFHGLMDSDGSISKERNRITYHSISYKLCKDVVSLVQSIGGIASIRAYDRSKENKPLEYQVRIKVPSGIAPFKITRKAIRYNPGSRCIPRRSIISVEYVRDVESVCISVASEDRLYVTECCILTHNTVEAIAYINAMNHRAGKRALHRILIACPADLRLNWKRELRMWLVHKYSIDTVEEGIFPSSDIVIISLQSLKRYADKLAFYWCLVVIDEAHYLSNPKTQMTKTMYGYRPSQKEIKAGEKMTSGVPAKYKIAMTGTPISNRPINIFTTINYLDPVSWPSRSQFVRDYCGGYVGGVYTDQGSTNQQELGELLRATVMIRRLKSDVLKELPPKQRAVCVLPIDKSELAKIGMMQKSGPMVAWMNQIARAKANLEIFRCIGGPEFGKAVIEMDAVMSRGAAATFELLHAIGLAKVKSAVEILQIAVDASPKVIIITHHQDVSQKIIAHFPKALLIDGSVSQEKRHLAVQRFQTDPEAGPIIVAMQCAKGITLTASSMVYFVEGSWLPRDIGQAEDRAHRIGQRDSVTVTHLVMEGSVDIVRANMIIQKQAVIESILDKDHRNDVESEPIIPMEGLTVTREMLVRAAAMGPVAPQILAELKSFSDSQIELMDRPDRLMREFLVGLPPDDRFNALGHALVTRWKNYSRPLPPPPRVVLPASGQPSADPISRDQQRLLAI